MYKKDLFLGKTVLVMGGGSGIGYAISEMLLRLGAKVVISSRNEERLQMAKEALSPYGPCEYSLVNMRLPESVSSFMADLEDKTTRIDVLINSAGGQFMQAAEDMSINGWSSIISNNLSGNWYITRAIAQRYFIPQKEGVIVNILAQIARGVPGMVHTGAAWAGIENMTKTLSIEWSKYNIRVNAVAPGIVDTEGMQSYRETVRKKGINLDPANIPLKRYGKPEEVAYSVLFLASPMAAYITGTVLNVDGGQRLWGDFWSLT